MATFEGWCDECKEYIDIEVDGYGVMADEFNEAIKSLVKNRLSLSTEEEELIIKLGKKVK